MALLLLVMMLLVQSGNNVKFPRQAELSELSSSC